MEPLIPEPKESGKLFIAVWMIGMDGISDKSLAELFTKLTIHQQSPVCKHRDLQFGKNMSSLWRDLLMFLEDDQPNGWQSLYRLLVAVPDDVQQAFYSTALTEGRYLFKAEKKPYGRLKNFAVHFRDRNAFRLVVGQLYEHVTPVTLYSFAEGIFEDYRKGIYVADSLGSYTSCVVIAFNLLSGFEAVKIWELELRSADDFIEDR